MVRSSFPWFLLTQVQNGLFSPQKLLAKGEWVFWAFREVSVPREAVRATEEVQSRPCAYLHNPALACAWPLNEGTDSIHRRRSIFSGFSFFSPLKWTSSQTACSQVLPDIYDWQNISHCSVSSYCPAWYWKVLPAWWTPLCPHLHPT